MNEEKDETIKQSPHQALIDNVETFNNLDIDLYFYVGRIDSIGLLKLQHTLQRKQKNVYLYLDSLGGYPADGFRIIQYIREMYAGGKLTIIIPHVSKSTATLMCVGADEVRLSPITELGPLDPQVPSKYSTNTYETSLITIKSLDKLNNLATKTLTSFIDSLFNYPGISKDKALDIATDLTKTFYSSLCSQIDLRNLTEQSLNIDYIKSLAERLNAYTGALKQDSLNRLIYTYIDHNYPITLKEATTLFNNVAALSPADTAFLRLWNKTVSMEILRQQEHPSVFNINSVIEGFKTETSTT